MSQNYERRAQEQKYGGIARGDKTAKGKVAKGSSQQEASRAAAYRLPGAAEEAAEELQEENEQPEELPKEQLKKAKRNRRRKKAKDSAQEEEPSLEAEQEQAAGINEKEKEKINERQRKKKNKEGRLAFGKDPVEPYTSDDLAEMMLFDFGPPSRRMSGSVPLKPHVPGEVHHCEWPAGLLDRMVLCQYEAIVQQVDCVGVYGYGLA